MFTATVIQWLRHTLHLMCGGSENGFEQINQGMEAKVKKCY